MSLAGRDYITVEGMMRLMQQNLRYCNVKSDHLSQVWAWKNLLEHRRARGVRGLDPVHALQFYRSRGIYVQWKQWCSDEDWCKPVLVAPPESVPTLGSFRPPCRDMVFPADGQIILDWIDRFQFWCASQPVGEY